MSTRAGRAMAPPLERATAEYRYEHPRRGQIWLRQSSRLVEGESGQGARIVEAVEDVTERRQALEDLQRLRERLERDNVVLRQEATRRLGWEHIVGRGAAIRRTLALAEQVAATDATALLLGETGSGKERFAAYIHERNRRHDRPMITVSCSSIPTPLIELRHGPDGGRAKAHPARAARHGVANPGSAWRRCAPRAETHDARIAHAEARPGPTRHPGPLTAPSTGRHARAGCLPPFRAVSGTSGS